MKVFFLGATGSIGFPAAHLLATRGHQVYGLARSDASAKKLAAAEITPVHAKGAGDVESYKELLSEVDLVIDCSSDADLIGTSRLVLQAVASAPRPSGIKLGYIYCSGAWVKSQGGDKIVSDLTRYDLDHVPLIVHGRVPFEQEVLQTRDKINVAIIQPGLVFGLGQSLLSLWLEPLLATKPGETLQLLADPDAWIPWIHANDLGRAFVATAERIELISQLQHPVFAIVGESIPLETVIKALGKVVGVTKIEYTLPDREKHLFPNAMSTSIRFDNSRSKHYLDWEPYIPSPLKYPEALLAAYHANK